MSQLADWSSPYDRIVNAATLSPAPLSQRRAGA